MISEIKDSFRYMVCCTIIIQSVVNPCTTIYNVYTAYLLIAHHTVNTMYTSTACGLVALASFPGPKRKRVLVSAICCMCLIICNLKHVLISEGVLTMPSKSFGGG